MLNQALTCGRGATVSTFTRIPGGERTSVAGRGGGETAERMSVRRSCYSARVADVSSERASETVSLSRSDTSSSSSPSFSPATTTCPPARSFSPLLSF